METRDEMQKVQRIMELAMYLCGASNSTVRVAANYMGMIEVPGQNGCSGIVVVEVFLHGWEPMKDPDARFDIRLGRGNHEADDVIAYLEGLCDGKL